MILVRHGESEFNVVYSVTRVDPGIRDPGLTDEGRRQAAEVARALDGRTIDRIVTSPYRRALETADIVASAIGAPVTVDRIIGERKLFTCDIGSPRSELAARWPRFDFGPLAEEWWPAEGESDDALMARCSSFRAAAMTLPAHDAIVVITHWGVIRALTGAVAANGEAIAFDPQ